MCDGSERIAQNQSEPARIAMPTIVATARDAKAVLPMVNKKNSSVNWTYIFKSFDDALA